MIKNQHFVNNNNYLLANSASIDEKLNVSDFSARGFLTYKYKCSRVPRSTKG